MVDISLVVWIVNPGIPILLGEIYIFWVQHIHQVQVSLICYLVDDNPECICHSGHCDQPD